MMLVKDIINELNLTKCHVNDESLQVHGGICTDLLSLVISNSSANAIWVTHQNHSNIIAVAVLGELSGIIVSGEIEHDTVELARQKGVNLFSTDKPTFEIVGKLYSLGVKGNNENI